MTALPLATFSDQLADVIENAAGSIVQVEGRRHRPASGVVFGPDLVLTTTRALGQDDHIRVRTADGRELEAELRGWDPTTSLVVVHAAALGGKTPAVSEVMPRVGHVAIAVGRSWSNVATASAGIVAIVGGPLPTGRGRAIDRVFRVTAPLHSGFAGGGLFDANGRLTGIATASQIRGLSVVIPADIAWKVAARLAEQGTAKRGYLGVAGQPARLSERQRQEGRTHGLVVIEVSPGSPAEAGGILTGDVIVAFDGLPVQSPVDLLELLQGDRVGRQVVIRILRGGSVNDVPITVGERTASK